MHSDRLKVFAKFTMDLSSLSKCYDRQVAAIAFDETATQIYSIGINGGPKGGKDCLCTKDGKYGCVHAEANCIAKCVTSDQNKSMICTLSPCVTCAALIANSGFKHVYYLYPWKDTAGLDLLTDCGIHVEQIKI